MVCRNANQEDLAIFGIWKCLDQAIDGGIPDADQTVTVIGDHNARLTKAGHASNPSAARSQI